MHLMSHLGLCIHRAPNWANYIDSRVEFIHSLCSCFSLPPPPVASLDKDWHWQHTVKALVLDLHFACLAWHPNWTCENEQKFSQENEQKSPPMRSRKTPPHPHLEMETKGLFRTLFPFWQDLSVLCVTLTCHVDMTLQPAVNTYRERHPSLVDGFHAVKGLSKAFLCLF